MNYQPAQNYPQMATNANYAPTQNAPQLRAQNYPQFQTQQYPQVPTNANYVPPQSYPRLPPQNYPHVQTQNYPQMAPNANYVPIQNQQHYLPAQNYPQMATNANYVPTQNSPRLQVQNYPQVQTQNYPQVAPNANCMPTQNFPRLPPQNYPQVQTQNYPQVAPNANYLPTENSQKSQQTASEEPETVAFMDASKSGIRMFLVDNLKVVGRGDHVAWKRPAGIWHHAIVVDVDLTTGQLDVIHNKPMFGQGGGGEEQEKSASVRREWIPVELESKDLFRVDYTNSSTRCFEPGEVVQRALDRLKEDKYNLFTNNCEHFATWCKTGQAKSLQLELIPQRLKAATDNVVEQVQRDGPLTTMNTLAKEVPAKKAASATKNLGLRGIARLGGVSTQLQNKAKKALN